MNSCIVVIMRHQPCWVVPCCSIDIPRTSQCCWQSSTRKTMAPLSYCRSKWLADILSFWMWITSMSKVKYSVLTLSTPKTVLCPLWANCSPSVSTTSKWCWIYREHPLTKSTSTSKWTRNRNTGWNWMNSTIYISTPIYRSINICIVAIGTRTATLATK